MTPYEMAVWGVLSGKVEICDLFIEMLENAKKRTSDSDSAISECIEIIKKIKDILQQGVEHTDQMCPNCVTPWKCNGPHIPPGIGRSYPGIYKALLKAGILSPNPEKSVLTVT